MKKLKPIVAGAIILSVVAFGTCLLYQHNMTVTYYVDPVNHCGGPDTKHVFQTAINVEPSEYKVEKVKRKDVQQYEESALHNGRCVSTRSPY